MLKDTFQSPFYRFSCANKGSSLSENFPRERMVMTGMEETSGVMCSWHMGLVGGCKCSLTSKYLNARSSWLRAPLFFVCLVINQHPEHPGCESPQQGSACPCPWVRAVLLLLPHCCLLSVQLEERPLSLVTWTSSFTKER